MIINDAVNILVQEIFIWISDNFLKRNSQKGNYSHSPAVWYLSLQLPGEVSSSCHPLSGWPFLPLRPGQRIFIQVREMQRGPSSPPRLFTWIHCMQSRASPCRNHFIINLETKAYLINHGNPPSHLPLFLFWGRWQIFFPLATSLEMELISSILVLVWSRAPALWAVSQSAACRWV